MLHVYFGAMVICTTVPEVIEALGGNRAVAALTKRTEQAVSNWKNAGFFSAATYLVMAAALEHAGYEAPPELWRIEPRPESKEASELPHNTA